MERLDNLIFRLRIFERELFQSIEKALRDEENFILELNTDEQLYKGISRDGAKISPDYTPYTISVKQSKGQPTNRVTLKDEGKFYGSFYIEFSETGFEIKAGDVKYLSLSYKYGDNLLGLSNENLEIVKDLIIKPTIIQKFKEL